MSLNWVPRAVLAGLLTFGVAFSAAPEEPAVLKDRMLDVIASHSDGAASIPRPALDGALARAQALEAIHLDAMGGETRVTLRTTGAPRYSATLDTDRDRLILHLADAIVLPDLQSLAINSGERVDSVEAVQHEIHPMFVTRIEILLTGDASVRTETLGADILVHIGEPGNAPAQAWYGMSPGELAAARATTDAIRRASASQPTRVRIRETLQLAQHHLESGTLALLQGDLADLASDGAPKTDLRRAYERQQAQTALLLSEFSAAETEWVTAVNALQSASGQSIDAYERAREHYAQQIRAIEARADHLVEMNELLARRLGTQTATALPGRHGDADARLAALDNAFATMRTTAALPSRTEAAQTGPDSVAPVEPALTAPDTEALAILKEDRNAGAMTPAPPRPRHTVSRIVGDAVTRPDEMAVLSSSRAELNRAERQGVIRVAQQIEDVQNGNPATTIEERQPDRGPRRYTVPKTTGTRPAFNLYNADMTAEEDPLRQLVNIDFRDMDLTNVVSLLAQKGQINVIAGTEVEGTVTANLKNIPLGRAIEIVLRMNGLGIVEEAGVYRITSYEESIAQQRETRMVFLQNAQADEVKETLEGILAADPNGQLLSVSANPSTNVVIISGPLESVEELEGVVSELDVSEPVIPTVTLPIKLNYSEPVALLPVIQPILGEEGKVTADARSRHIIVTDIPVKVQEIQALIQTIDLPVKQVGIDAMVVDAQLDDDATSGVEWFLNSPNDDLVATTSTFTNSTSEGLDIETEGNVIPEIGTMQNFLPAGAASQLAFSIIGNDIELGAIIAAQVESNDAELLANPSIVTVENQPATINITQEFPFQELTQTAGGGQLGTTEFKEIGTILEVTPRVTHDNHIIAAIQAKQSTVVGFTSSDVPIEAVREATTTLRLADGQTIFIGGLRSMNERLDVRKTPILGDIPVLNFAFSNKRSTQTHTELLIFLPCNVLPDRAPDLTPYQREKYDKLGGTPAKVDGTRAIVNSYIHPDEQRDPFYKWRRTK